MLNDKQKIFLFTVGGCLFSGAGFLADQTVLTFVGGVFVALLVPLLLNDFSLQAPGDIRPHIPSLPPTQLEAEQVRTEIPVIHPVDAPAFRKRFRSDGSPFVENVDFVCSEDEPTLVKKHEMQKEFVGPPVTEEIKVDKSVPVKRRKK